MIEYPVAFVVEDGGEWIPVNRFHAMKFANGAIWDEVNGWRKNVRVRVKMGRAVV